MGLFSRFFGRRDDDDSPAGELVANPAVENPLSLQVLLADPQFASQDELTRALRSFDPSMSKARVEIDAELSRDGNIFGLVGWKKHVVKIFGLGVPMPSDPVEACLQPSHYAPEIKERARQHQAHVLLWYAGYVDDTGERYLALTAVAGMLAMFGAVVVLNESAHTSLPADMLIDPEFQGNRLDFIRDIPLLMLNCGFVKCEVEGVQGVWMRTFGAHQYGLPDFAAHAAGHHEGERYFGIFENTLCYLRDSKAEMLPGHTMQIGEEEFLRCREPTPEEDFLGADGELLVVDIIRKDQINRRR
jgi:hypothetical protein